MDTLVAADGLSQGLTETLETGTQTVEGVIPGEKPAHIDCPDAAHGDWLTVMKKGGKNTHVSTKKHLGKNQKQLREVSGGKKEQNQVGNYGNKKNIPSGAQAINSIITPNISSTPGDSPQGRKWGRKEPTFQGPFGNSHGASSPSNPSFVGQQNGTHGKNMPATKMIGNKKVFVFGDGTMTTLKLQQQERNRYKLLADEEEDQGNNMAIQHFASVEHFWRDVGYELVGCSEAVGHRGRIWILASVSRNFTVQTVDVHFQVVSVSISVDHMTWRCSAVYASPNPMLREELWGHLVHLRHQTLELWLALSDFNEITSPTEVSGGYFCQARATRMLNMMEACEFIDLGAIGGSFTWERRIHGNRKVSKRLDRALGDISWRHIFPKAYVEHLARVYSDHCPILVRCNAHMEDRTARPFRFHAAWATHPAYENVVRGTWEKPPPSLVGKLDNVRMASLAFNTDAFGNITRRKKRVERRLQGLQRELEVRETKSLLRLEKDLREEYEQIMTQEEIYWYQKSREKWVRLGDRNTKFFHTQKVTRNHVMEIRTPSIYVEERAKLINPVSLEEVRSAVMAMQPFKAPGPDGFQEFFYKQFWSIVGQDLHFMVDEAFAHGQRDSSLLETLIVLIPKKRVDEKSWKPVRITKEGIGISRLFFADDVLLFCQANKVQMQVVADTLKDFCEASGIRRAANLGKYLGIPLLKGRVTRDLFFLIMDKVNARLAFWKTRMLNKAGKLCLAKSVLTSLPVYTMQSLWLPQSVCEFIDKKIRCCLWGKGSNNRGVNLVSWGDITQPKESGGLGLRNTRGNNIALLGKLVHECLHDGTKPWVQAISQKYLKQNLVLQGKYKNGDSYIWKSIMRAKDYVGNGFQPHLSNGQSSVWYSNWLGMGRLCDRVSFVNIADTQLVVADLWDNGQWNFHLLYTLLPPDIEDEVRNIHVPHIRSHFDALRWWHDTGGCYSPSTAYHSLYNQAEDGFANWRKVWKAKVPERVCFFLWLVSREALPTNFRRFQSHLAVSAGCPRCDADTEDVDHLLRGCPDSRNLWSYFCSVLPPLAVQVPLSQWLGELLSHANSTLGISVMWWAWKRQCQCVFELQATTINQVLRCVLRDEALWRSTLFQQPGQLHLMT
ncbi:uncharacterized protein LOC130719710 [Lotus japonicus]|uniref:uncharacterized protein LOC130719710 n=1 Tax=Lotus japonicus TaxID=34305 RepID=UPI00258FD2D8|nr:uncharacterized protein LOC130719710 [Lotus japonicus]